MSADPHAPACGGILVASGGQALALRSARLTGRMRGGVARVTLQQTFENPHAEALHVTYQLPLPADGAVSGFSFRIGDREIVGQVDRKDRARERFEQAIAEGRTAAHLEQERSSLFRQEIGNIPPGATVIARVEVDQPLTWIADAGKQLGGWEWRFPTVVAPRYLGQPGRVADGPRVAVAVADAPRPITMGLEVVVADTLPEGTRPDSPSHALALGRGGVVQFVDSTVGLDRDVVVRWPVAKPQVGVSVDVTRPGVRNGGADDLFGLLTVVPPAVRREAPVARDLVVLLDTSGSMGGEPLAQAKRVAAALVDGLAVHDTLELIEFSSQARRFAERPVPADPASKANAQHWIASLQAGGGTEMVSGILAALQGVRSEAQRQVIVVTDGLIGFERDVLSAIIERLPSGSRLHTVGVGSAVNRSLTGPAARAGRGVEVVVAIGEDPERATRRLLARTQAPLVVDLTVEGSALLQHAPVRLPDLYAESPVLIPVRMASGGGELRLRGRTASGSWEARTQVRPPADGVGNVGLAALFGREQVEDLELSGAAGENASEIDAAIVEIGLRFSIATRLTSWLAVSEQVDVDAREPTRRQVVPQELPHGMSVEGLGVRRAMPAASMDAMSFAQSQVVPQGSGGGGPGRGRTRGGLRMSKRSRPVREEGAIEGSPEKSKLAPAPSPAAPPAQPLTRGTPPTLYLDEEASDDGFDDGVDAAEAAPTDKEERAFVGSEATPVLSGEVVRHADGTWTFAFDRPAAMGWPVLAAALELADGTALEGELTSMHETTANTEGVRRTEVVFTPTQDREGEAHALRITIDGRAYTVVFSSSAPTP